MSKVVYAGKPGAPLSKAVKANGFLFLTGHVAGPAANIDANSIASQTTGSLENIQRTLKECGASLEDVVRVTIYLTDMADKKEMNEAYIAFFPNDPPARSCIGVKELGGPEYRIEIDVVAAVED
ncbi:MAG TPA: RidA family protein [Thermomicrobiales bacterium]|nr:RidA family protein [Thermomicrobiales bacterium]